MNVNRVRNILWSVLNRLFWSFFKNFLKTLAKSQSAVLYIVRDKVQQKPLFGRDIEWENTKGVGIFPTRENAAHFTERVPLSYACCGRSKRQMGTHWLCLLLTQDKERTGKEWKGNEKLNTTICYRKRATRWMKSLHTKLAARFMKCQRFAAALNCSMTKWNGS